MSTRCSIVRCSSSVIVETKVIFWCDNRLLNIETDTIGGVASILVEKDVLIIYINKETANEPLATSPANSAPPLA